MLLVSRPIPTLWRLVPILVCKLDQRLYPVNDLTISFPVDEALVSIDYFPFFKLPLELRRRVYEQHINDLLPESWSGAMRPCTRPSCGCLRVAKANTEQPEVLQLTLARTSRAVKNEFLATWFESQYFSFRCGCELRESICQRTPAISGYPNN